MKSILFALLSLLVALPSVAQIQIPKDSGSGYQRVFTAIDEAGFYDIGKAFPMALIGFEHGSAFVGEIFACQGPASLFNVDTCDSITGLAQDVSALVFQTTRLYYVVEVTTPETGTNQSRLVIRGTESQISDINNPGFAGAVREVFSGTLDGGGTATTTDGTTFKQLELDLTEYADSLADIGISADGNLLCNTSANELTFGELHITGHMQHISTQQRNFIVRVGTCLACIGDAFPQLVSGDEVATANITASYTNNLDSVPIPFTAVLASVPPDSCIGLMVFGDSGRQVLLVAGTLSLFAGDPVGGASQALQNQILTTVETSRLFLTATFGGSGGSVTAVDTEWRQLPLDLLVRESHGDDLDVSADGNLICNNTGFPVNGGFIAAINMNQSGAASKTLLFRLGARVGEGALVDGDEVSTIQVQIGFTAPGMSDSQVVIPGHGTQSTGVCVGIMVRSTSGSPFFAYTAAAGTVAVTFARELP